MFNKTTTNRMTTDVHNYSSSAVQITTACAQDLNAIITVEQGCFSTPWDADAIQSELTQLTWSQTIIARLSNATVGYACFWNIADEIQLMKIAVLPDYQNHGIGSALLAYIIAEGCTKKMNNISLELRESNFTAQKLYEKFQFRVVGTRPGYYTDTGEAAILMNYRFPSSATVIP